MKDASIKELPFVTDWFKSGTAPGTAAPAEPLLRLIPGP